jgi:CheY-like chemotaxis protein
MMRLRALRKGLTLDVAYRGAIPETIQADPTRLRQILINLLGNAIKFTEAGGVRLEVSFRSADPPSRSQLRLDVIDTGPGLAPQDQEELFTPFTQADSSTTREFGGTGLGLAISKRLAAMLGGDIEVSSVVGEGSTFSLTVDTGPLDGVSMLDDPTEAVRRAATVEPHQDKDLRLAGRVLLAEDSPDIQQLIAFYLRKSGAEVTTAENGLTACEQALQAADSDRPFNLILMDMHMPKLDGYAATARLRAHGYGGPIVALTANALEQDRKRCQQAGCDAFIGKPVARSVLLETIRPYLAPYLEEEADLVTPAHDDATPRLTSDLATDPALAPLLERFASLLPARIEAMERTFAHRDIPALADLAHQLKGAAGLYGFPAISAAAQQLEATAQNNGDVERNLALLADLCLRVRPTRPTA